MEMVKATLNSSYGYLDPKTGARKYYGPGKDIDIPYGLALTLGQTTEASVADTVTLLPDDFPAHATLKAAGVTTLEQVQALSEADLIAIKGIGKTTAKVIMEALSDYAS